jgi:hypothetical protein
MTTPKKPDVLTSFFQKEDIKKMSKEIIKPIVNIIYDEIYPYIWFICIYNVFLIFITLANLFLVIRWINGRGGGGGGGGLCAGCVGGIFME